MMCGRFTVSITFNCLIFRKSQTTVGFGSPCGKWQFKVNESPSVTYTSLIGLLGKTSRTERTRLLYHSFDPIMGILTSHFHLEDIRDSRAKNVRHVASVIPLIIRLWLQECDRARLTRSFPNDSLTIDLEFHIVFIPRITKRSSSEHPYNRSKIDCLHFWIATGMASQ